MVTRKSIDDFLALSNIAVVGVSRSGKKFGNSVLRDLKIKGYKTFPVNPNTSEIGGEKCYPDLRSIPENIDGVVLVIPPQETNEVVKDAAQLGIKNIWMQQGAGSKEAVKFCNDNGINVVDGECIMMFAEPAAFIHRFHRGINKLVGRLPK